MKKNLSHFFHQLFSHQLYSASPRHPRFFSLTLFALCSLLLPACAELGVVQDRLAPKQIEGGKVLFQYYSPSARTVTVAGTLNNWEYRQDQSRTIYMKKNDKGIWDATVQLAPGRYHYKFVIDYQTWVLDDNNPLTEDPDNNGDIKSLIVVK